MSWIKRFLFMGVGITVPLSVGIIILELVFGSWLREDKWQPTKELNIIRNAKITYNVENIYGKELPRVNYTRDSNGLRGSCADPKDISILTIGGSTTDQRFISDGMTYQDVLQKLLSNKADRLICVSNAGVDGHSTFGHLFSFRNWFPLIVGLEPKYVLFYIGINDASFEHGRPSEYDVRNRDGKSNIRHAFRMNSAIYDLLRSLQNLKHSMYGAPAYAGHSVNMPSKNEYVATKKTNGVEVDIKNNTENFDKRFKALLLQVQSLGAKPICVSQPHLLSREFGGVKKGIANAFVHEGITYNGLDYDASINSLNNSIEFICIKNGGYYLDMSTKEFTDGDFYDVVHMKPSGATRLGHYLFDEFINKNIPL